MDRITDEERPLLAPFPANTQARALAALRDPRSRLRELLRDPDPDTMRAVLLITALTPVQLGVALPALERMAEA